MHDDNPSIGKIKNVHFIVSLRITAVLHRKPETTGTSVTPAVLGSAIKKYGLHY
jgi:hypothetical protein